jgi:hypothetical protein
MITLKDLSNALLFVFAFGVTAHAMTSVDGIAGAQENVAAGLPEEEEDAKVSANNLQSDAFDVRSNAMEEEEEEDGDGDED